jgi:hypothetical protein
VRQDTPMLLPQTSPCPDHQGPGWEAAMDRPSHARIEDDRPNATHNLHAMTPRPYNGAMEIMSHDTREVLVCFLECGHHEAVFLPVLREAMNGSCAKASCGCSRFDRELIASRRAVSRQKCLHCRFHSGLTPEALALPQPVFTWFSRYARKVEDGREIGLWPFHGRAHNGFLSYN